jgi:hypothetical protein
MANSTQQNNNMLEKMQSLATTISKLQTQVNNTNQTQTSNNNQTTRGQDNRGRGRGSNREGRGNHDGRGTNKQPPQYCWSHGNCAHNGTDCHTPAEGHINHATYSNMQGGSKNRCHWL